MVEIVDAKEVLRRIQVYDANSLAQREKLGAAYHFENAVEPAKKLIALFQKIPVEVFDEIPDTERDTIVSQANSVYNIFEQVIAFDATVSDAQGSHSNLLAQLSSHYQRLFTAIHPLISFSMARTVDFNSLADQGRAAVQGVKDQSAAILLELTQQKSEAQGILNDVRQAAAEQGVSQQASYFASEASTHEKEAGVWRKYTVRMAIAVGAFGFGSLFFHKIWFLSPGSTAESIQFIASKLLIFSVLVYMLLLCSRNFMSHKHNAIVNKHRQNSLMTYKALVNAGATPEARDTVLNHAAASIYRLHDTGYVRGSEKGASSSSSLVELLPKASFPVSAN